MPHRKWDLRIRDILAAIQDDLPSLTPQLKNLLDKHGV
jgi:hypothetical protein